jgi:hypothetical protein
MLALALPVLLGVSIGVLTGGRLGRWHTSKLDGWLPACVALALQLVIFDPPLERVDWIIHFGPLLYLASMGVILLVLIQSAKAQPGRLHSVALATAALGVLLNCAVVATNGGYMPREAADGFRPVAEPAEVGRLVNVRPMTSQTRLVLLGDIIAEPAWVPLPNILSIGDLLLAGGLGAWAFAVTRVELRPRWRQSASGAEALWAGESAST